MTYVTKKLILLMFSHILRIRYFLLSPCDNSIKQNMSYSLPRFTMLNFRRQGSPKFVSKMKKNPHTNKTETYEEIQNDAGYAFKAMTPPCLALYPKLAEGGNLGGKYSKTKDQSHIMTHLLRAGNEDEEQFQSERDAFFEWLADINEQCLKQMYDSDVSGTATAAREKTKKRYGKNKTPEELEAMSYKAYKKTATVPLKVKDGEEQVVMKCRAFTRDNAPRAIRYVQPVGTEYVEMDDIPELRNGALLSTVFSVRHYAMAKDKYGITYSLVPDVVVYSTGKGRSAAPLEEIEQQGREYQLSDSEDKEGRRYLNINDTKNRRMEMRVPPTEVVFGDSLTGTGTLGNIAGVTEKTAKYTAVTKEDTSNPASVAFFDYATKMADDCFEYVLNSPTLNTKLKESSKEEAEEMAEETGDSFEECFRTVMREAYNTPVSKREQDDFRQLRFSQNVYARSGAKNIIPMVDSTGATVEDDISRGAMIAPVLVPSVYFMADGKFGLKFGISLAHGIRVDSNESSSDASGGVLYALKRSRSEDEDASPTKRARTDSSE